MKVAVIGAGAIGGLVAAYLKHDLEDVTLVCRPHTAGAVNKNGLRVSGVRGEFNIKIDCRQKLDFQPDLCILATKTQDLESAVKDNLEFLKSSLVLTTQNGVQAELICSGSIPKENIISSIVMFGSTSLEPGLIVHNFEGSWIIGKAFAGPGPELAPVAALLNKVFPVVTSPDIKGMKYLKIFVNANNCIPALLGRSMQESFSGPEVSAISIAIWREGLEVIRKAGIELKSLPDFPLERLAKLAGMPLQEAAKIYSGIMQNLSKEPLYGSILQSIKRGRPSEIDFINAEFVRLAEAHQAQAPLNAKLVEMVHQVEKSGKFFSKEELLGNTKGLY